jgi:hypothetical protein
MRRSRHLREAQRPMTNSQATTSESVGRKLRQGLGHPVIDVDGHLQELSTFFNTDVLGRLLHQGLVRPE